MKDLLPNKKDSFAKLEPTGTVVKYGSGYIRIHTQQETQNSHCTSEKHSDICKNKAEII